MFSFSGLSHQNKTSSCSIMSCTTSFCSLMSFRVIRAFISGGCMSVGPKTIPRFSAFIRLYFSNSVTLQNTKLVCKTTPPCTKAPTVRRQVSPLTSSGEPSGNAGSRSGLGAAGVNSHGWPPVGYQHLESLHHISGDTIRLRVVMVEQPGEVREALTRSLDEFRVQFERNHRNGEVSQVQFQSTGNDVDVSIGTGADVGLLPV